MEQQVFLQYIQFGIVDLIARGLLSLIWALQLGLLTGV